MRVFLSCENPGLAIAFQPASIEILQQHLHLLASRRSPHPQAHSVQKTAGMLRQVRHRGLERVGWVFHFGDGGATT